MAGAGDDRRTEITVLGFALCQLLLELLDLLCLLAGREVVLGGGCGLVCILRRARNDMGWDTCRLFQLGVLFLHLNEVEHDRERARQDEREEKAEACEIHVPLGAAEAREGPRRGRRDDLLELARGNVGFGAGVVDGVVCAGGLELGGDAEHALEGVRKENADKDEGDLEAIGDLGDGVVLCEEAEEALADGVREGEHEDAERDHLRG